MNKAVFLDRDGTINVEKDYLYNIEDFEYLPDVIDGLRLFQEKGYLIIVITNQSGIARGYYTEDDYHRLDKWMKDDLAQKGIKITASYYCPHLPEAVIPKYAIECDCRKPKLGMYYKAVDEWNIDLDNSIAIGDKLRDLAICDHSKCRGILISEEDKEVPENVERVKDWMEIASKC